MLSRGGLGGLGRVAVWALLCGLPAIAQLPAAPIAADSTQAQQGSISGTVVDADGDAIAGAHVTLAADAQAGERKVDADGEGYFSFTGLAAGTFKLSIAADGFATTVKTVTLHPNEDVETADVVLPVASANMDVNVSLSPYELAEEELVVEEHQRLGGFVPNFYVTYNWHAPRMSPGQKFRLAWRSIYDPANIVLTAGIAGVEQATKTFRGYGQGAQGYGKRLGAGLADATDGNLLGGAFFPILLRQDPRYFYKGTGSILLRALYALSTAFICRGDNGKWQPNYSSVLGDVATGAISNTYYPASDRNGAVVTIETGLLNAAEDGIGNLLQEFLFRKITPGASKP